MDETVLEIVIGSIIGKLAKRFGSNHKTFCLSLSLKTTLGGSVSTFDKDVE